MKKDYEKPEFYITFFNDGLDVLTRSNWKDDELLPDLDEDFN